MRLGDGSTAQQALRFRTSDGDWQIGSNNFGNGTNDNQLFFYDVHHGQVHMCIQRGTGNIGIGTQAPTKKLHVNGNFFVENPTRSGKGMLHSHTTNDSNTSNGWSEISASDNNSDGNTDTIIKHTEYMPAGNGDPESTMGVAAVTYGPDNKVTKFISSNVDYEMGDGSGTKVFYQGVTDENKYRRRILAADGTTALDTQCFDRSKEWNNTWDYNLYDNVTGAEVKISGSFGFTYSSGTKRG